MSEELKPCPFCGAKASIQRYSSGTGGPKCAVWCDACHVGTSWLHGDDGEERVVAEWNRRTSVAARELDVEAERRELDAEMDAAWQAYRKGRLRPLADAVLFCAGFRAARSAAQGTAPAPADESLSSDEIEALRAALSWMGESTYETLEECGIYQRSLLRRLIHAVVANRDATFAAQSTQPESAQVSTEQAGRRRQGTEMNRASPSQQRKAIEIANLFVKMGVGFVPVPVASAEEFEQLATQSIEKMSQLADALDDSPVGGKD